MGFKHDSGKMIFFRKDSQGKPGKSLLKISMNLLVYYVVKHVKCVALWELLLIECKLTVITGDITLLLGNSSCNLIVGVIPDWI